MSTSGGIQQFFFGVYPTAGTLAARTKVTGDAFNRWELYADGTQKYGGGTLATDTTVGRLAFEVFGTTVGSIRAEQQLQALTDVVARRGAASQTEMGNKGPGGESGIALRQDALVKAYAESASIFRVNVQLRATDRIYAKVGLSSEVGTGDVGPAAEAGIAFGTAGTDRIWRSAAGRLSTGGEFLAQAGIYTDNLNSFSGGSVRMPSVLRQTETTTPTAPVADSGLVYMKDNGAGKTQYVVMFSDGLEIVLATMA